MARYIDLDKAIERIESSPAFPNMGMDGYFLRDVVCDLLKKQPTDDVAPKSDYDAVVSAVDNSTKEFLKLHDDYQDAIQMVERLKNMLDSYAFQYGTVTDKQAIINHERAEVAREIFEEIERLIKITAFADCWSEGGFKQDIAELKKKYTEEKE